MNTRLLTILALASSIPAIGSTDMMSDLVAHRHSGYAFDMHRRISSDHMAMIMKAGQMAPSSYNDQPWFFIVGDRSKNPEVYDKIMSALDDFKDYINQPVKDKSKYSESALLENNETRSIKKQHLDYLLM